MTFTIDSAARILAGGSGDLLSVLGCRTYLSAHGYELDNEQMHAVMKRAAEYRRSLRHPPIISLPASGANGGALVAGNGAVADVIVPRSATAPDYPIEEEIAS